MQSAYYVFGLYAMGRTFGGARWLSHVGAGRAAAAIVICAVLSAIIGVTLVRNKAPMLPTLLVGGVSAYFLLGVFSGQAILQLLMPPFVESAVIWTYLVGAGLSLFTIPMVSEASSDSSESKSAT